MPTGSSVLLKKSKKHKVVKPGTLKLAVKCDQNASVSLSGKLTIHGKKVHGKVKNTVLSLSPAHGSVKAGVSDALLIKLPAKALAALKKGAKESIAFALTATNGNGTGTASATIGSVRRLS